MDKKKTTKRLHYGWTTGTCATAAVKAAEILRLYHRSSTEVTIALPRGRKATLPIQELSATKDGTYASVVKDGGDDPDITHGALIQCWLRPNAKGQGITFTAGKGVGTVTLAGLSLHVGQAAINPVPREMIIQTLKALHPTSCDLDVTIGIKNGEKLAKDTLNGRLGIKGGLSILGTTGIVVPFSCAAWIETIHRCVDVARHMGEKCLIGATGDMSAQASQKLTQSNDRAVIEMGDFVGGFVKYVKHHPVQKIIIAAGPGKMTKIAQGRRDLRASQGRVNKTELLKFAQKIHLHDTSCKLIKETPTIGQLLTKMGADKELFLNAIAKEAHSKIMDMLSQPHIQCEIMIFNRTGECLSNYQ